MKRIRSGDTVIVTTGKSKGFVGKILKVSDDKVYVEGANLLTKHQKSTREGEQGKIIKKEAPIHVSNVAMFNSNTSKADKISFTILENGKKVRVFKSDNTQVDKV